MPVKPDGTVVDVTLRAASFALALDVVALLVEQSRAPGLSPVTKSDAGVVGASLVPGDNKMKLFWCTFFPGWGKLLLKVT